MPVRSLLVRYVKHSRKFPSTKQVTTVNHKLTGDIRCKNFVADPPQFLSVTVTLQNFILLSFAKGDNECAIGYACHGILVVVSKTLFNKTPPWMISLFFLWRCRAFALSHCYVPYNNCLLLFPWRCRAFALSHCYVPYNNCMLLRQAFWYNWLYAQSHSDSVVILADLLPEQAGFIIVSCGIINLAQCFATGAPRNSPKVCHQIIEPIVRESFKKRTFLSVSVTVCFNHYISGFNGLLFHITQPTNRSPTKSHCTEQTNHNDNLVKIRANENAMTQCMFDQGQCCHYWCFSIRSDVLREISDVWYFGNKSDVDCAVAFFPNFLHF